MKEFYVTSPLLITEELYGVGRDPTYSGIRFYITEDSMSHSLRFQGVIHLPLLTIFPIFRYSGLRSQDRHPDFSDILDP